MRDIKFRAWHRTLLKMFDVSVMERDIGYFWVGSKDHEASALCGLVGTEVDLMQYTFLKDDAGVEVYEGDIVSYHPYHNMGHSTDKCVGAVEWDETGDSDCYHYYKHYEWVVNADSLADVADSDFPESSYCVVIGNIYENPLLVNATLEAE